MVKLTPFLKHELNQTKEDYQDNLAYLLYYASAMGDYGDPHGVLAVISPEGKVLIKEGERAN